MSLTDSDMYLEQQADLGTPDWREEAEALYYRHSGDSPWEKVADGPTLEALPGFKALVSEWKKKRLARSMGHRTLGGAR